jgi:hypothetical protein
MIPMNNAVVSTHTVSIIVDLKMPKGCPETGLPLSIYIFFLSVGTNLTYNC